VFNNNPFVQGNQGFSQNSTAGAISQGGGLVSRLGNALHFDSKFGDYAGKDVNNIGNFLNPMSWVKYGGYVAKGDWQGAIDNNPLFKVFENVGGDNGSYGPGLIGTTFRALDLVDNTARGAVADLFNQKRIGERTGNNLYRATAGGQDYSLFQVRSKGASPFALIPEKFDVYNPGHWGLGVAGFLGDAALGVFTGAAIGKTVANVKKIGAIAGLTKDAKPIKTVARASTIAESAGQSAHLKKLGEFPTNIPVPKTPIKLYEEALNNKATRIQQSQDLLNHTPGTLAPEIKLAPTPRTSPVPRIEVAPKEVTVQPLPSSSPNKTPYAVKVQTDSTPTLVPPTGRVEAYRTTRREEMLKLGVPEGEIEKILNSESTTGVLKPYKKIGNNKVGWPKTKRDGLSASDASLLDFGSVMDGHGAPFDNLRKEGTSQPHLTKKNTDYQRMADKVSGEVLSDTPVDKTLLQDQAALKASAPEGYTGLRNKPLNEWERPFDSWEKVANTPSTDLVTIQNKVYDGFQLVQGGDVHLGSRLMQSGLKDILTEAQKGVDVSKPLGELFDKAGHLDGVLSDQAVVETMRILGKSITEGGVTEAHRQVATRLLNDATNVKRLFKAAATDGTVIVDTAGNIHETKNVAESLPQIHPLPPIVTGHDINNAVTDPARATADVLARRVDFTRNDAAYHSGLEGGNKDPRTPYVPIAEQLSKASEATAKSVDEALNSPEDLGALIDTTKEQVLSGDHTGAIQGLDAIAKGTSDLRNAGANVDGVVNQNFDQAGRLKVTDPELNKFDLIRELATEYWDAKLIKRDSGKWAWRVETGNPGYERVQVHFTMHAKTEEGALQQFLDFLVEDRQDYPKLFNGKKLGEMLDRALGKAPAPKGETAITPQALEALSPVIKPQELIPQPKVSEALQALKDNPDVFVSTVSPVTRTNAELTQLAVFLGHVNPRKTPLSGVQLDVLRQQHGDLYEKLGGKIDTAKLSNPAARIEVQAGNTLAGEPRVTRLLANKGAVDVAEQAGSLDELKKALDQRRNILTNLTPTDNLDALKAVDDRIANMGPIDYAEPKNMEVIQKSLPSELRTTTPEGHTLTVKLVQTEDNIAEVATELQGVQKELADLENLHKADSRDILHNVGAAPDTHEAGAAFSKSVWDLEHDTQPGHVPLRLNPKTTTDALQELITPELPKIDWYHGSRVDPNSHDLRFIDPDKNTTLHEMGPGVYLTTDPESAKYFADAHPSKNLPPGTQISDTGTVAQVIPRVEGYTLVANQAPDSVAKNIFRDAAIKAGAPLQVVKSFMSSIGQAATVDGLWDKFYQVYRKTTGGADTGLFHRFQVEVANGLRTEGYGAIVKLPEKQGDEAILNILGKGGDEMPLSIGKVAQSDAPDLLDAMAARASAEKAKGLTSDSGKYLQTKARLDLNTQAQDLLKQKERTLIDKAEALLTTNHKIEQRLADIAKESAQITAQISQRAVETVKDTVINEAKNPEGLNPCL
jgi:hypothetical protein